MGWDDGFVLEHRSVMEHAVFQDDWLYRLFRWCIMKANYQPGVYRGEPIGVGSFATGTLRGAEALGVSHSKFYRGLHKLAEPPYEVISINPKRDFTIVTVCNYGTYQTSKDGKRNADETQVKRQRNASETPAKTIEQEKQTNKAKQEIPALPPGLNHPPFPEMWVEWLAYRTERRLSTRDRTMRAQLQSLSPLGPVAAAECLRKSIRCGWAGVFPEKEKPRAASTVAVHDPAKNADTTGDPTYGRM